MDHSPVVDESIVLAHSRVAESGIVELIGATPMVRIRHIGSARSRVEIYAKAEWYNPGGSVKDRPALSMILEGERSGKLVPGKTILDATSGNTGIAYAMIGASLGYGVEVYVPKTASSERKQLLKLYGAKITETPAELGTDGAIEEARRRYREAPELYF